MIARFLCLILMMLAATTASRAATEQRVALVIGNGTYKNTIELPNAPSDAAAVAASLRRLGFLVVEGSNLTYSGMTDKLREFSRALNGADVGLVYYAGHGMQVAGENYLIPVDAALKQESDLEFEAVKVDAILHQLQLEAKVKVVILDACRDNPLVTELARSMAASSKSKSRSAATSAGLSAIDTQSASGTIIAFATAPGTVALDGQGAHSPFTAALLDNMETPGIDIDVMMKRVRGEVARTTGDRQQPWTNSSLTAEFYMRPAEPTADKPTVVATATPADGAVQPQSPAAAGFNPQQMEFALWNAAEATKTAADYEAYVSKYPNGTFAEIARNRIAALQSGKPVDNNRGLGSAAPTIVGPADENAESQLDLDKTQWRAIQAKLNELGFSIKRVDGEPGATTRQAIRDWQSSKSYPATGYLDHGQHVALVGEAAAAERGSRRGDDAPRRRRSYNSGGSYSGGNNNLGAAAAGQFFRGVLGSKLGF
jgi:uncharacterized caspase-like protein